MSKSLDAYVKIKVNMEPTLQGFYEVCAGGTVLGWWSEEFLDQLGVQIPRPIKEGDEVTRSLGTSYGLIYTVLTIDRTMAFLKRGSVSPQYAIVPVENLKRVNYGKEPT